MLMMHEQLIINDATKLQHKKLLHETVASFELNACNKFYATVVACNLLHRVRGPLHFSQFNQNQCSYNYYLLHILYYFSIE